MSMVNSPSFQSDDSTMMQRNDNTKSRRINSVPFRKAVSLVVRLALLAIATGRYELGIPFVAVDAFGTHPSRRSILTQRRALCRNFGNPPLDGHLVDGGSVCGRRSTTSPRTFFFSTTTPSRCVLRVFPNDDPEASNDNNRIAQLAQSTVQRFQQVFLPSLTVVWWPLFAAVGIPALVSFARSFPPNSSEQFAAVTLLIVANRIYLYALGLTIVATAAVRGSADPKELGQRLTVLTEELLVLDKPLATEDPPSTTDGKIATSSASSVVETSAPAPSFVKKMVDNSGLEENLDGVDAGTQALVLPALVAGLLALSVISLPIWSEGFLASPNDASLDVEWISQLQGSLSKVLPFLGQAWNAILLTLFTRADFRRLGSELLGIGIAPKKESSEGSMVTSVPKAQIIIECLLAVAVTGYGAYYLQYWPAQNFVNSAIAILVARAIRLDSFNAVVSALALLALYDGASVLLIPGVANAVMDAAASVGASGNNNLVDGSMAVSAASNPASSAMGSVAMQKLTSGGFQPGLLVTKLDGDKLTGTLGLGDAVFPSILASFLRRFDEDCNTIQSDDRNKSRLFEASLGGYIAGCLACELVPTIATRGVPALVFIVPFMGLATILAAIQAGRFEELRQYNNEATE